MSKLNSDKIFQKGKHSIGYLSDSFKERFDNVSFEPRALGAFQVLPRSMSDAEIESELKPGICELGDVSAFLENPPEGAKDGNWNLFYTSSYVVGVGWGGSSWSVRAWGRGSRWIADGRVFSPATNSKTLDTEPSDTLALRTCVATEEIAKQLKRIANSLEKPKKSKGRKT